MYSTIVLQEGPVKEVGENGDQIDDIIRFCRDKLVEFQKQLPDHHTRNAIEYLNDTLNSLRFRTREREERGVEGKSQP